MLGLEYVKKLLRAFQLQASSLRDLFAWEHHVVIIFSIEPEEMDMSRADILQQFGPTCHSSLQMYAVCSQYLVFFGSEFSFP